MKKILIVEDDETVLELLRTVFSLQRTGPKPLRPLKRRVPIW